MTISENAASIFTASIFNICEGSLWLLIGFVITIRFARKRPVRSFYWLLPAAFIVFGVSDFIESKTGAFWRPWWLFVMKTGCVAAFLLVAFLHQRITRRKG